MASEAMICSLEKPDPAVETAVVQKIVIAVVRIAAAVEKNRQGKLALSSIAMPTKRAEMKTIAVLAIAGHPKQTSCLSCLS